MVMTRSRTAWWVTISRIAAAIALVTTPYSLAASELSDRTRKAYEGHREEVTRIFLARAADPPVVRRTGITAGPARGDGILDVPGGLVHHWKGATFLPGVTLRQALEASRDYARYPAIYKAVVSARLLEQQGHTYRVQMRIRGGGGGISAVLDIRSMIEFVDVSPRRAYSMGNSEEIREVENAGKPNERLLPAGRDSGYLWRGNTFTLFNEVDGGLMIEMETLGLSRSFPPLLGWIIEPVARRLGRRSVETSLREFAAALPASAAPQP